MGLAATRAAVEGLGKVETVTEHTPGPWQVQNGINVVGADEYIVARGGYEGPIAHGEANARLIAAAPALLEAAQATVDAEMLDDLAIARAQLRAAIKEATA